MSLHQKRPPTKFTVLMANHGYFGRTWPSRVRGQNQKSNEAPNLHHVDRTRMMESEN